MKRTVSLAVVFCLLCCVLCSANAEESGSEMKQLYGNVWITTTPEQADTSREYASYRVETPNFSIYGAEDVDFFTETLFKGDAGSVTRDDQIDPNDGWTDVVIVWCGANEAIEFGDGGIFAYTSYPEMEKYESIYNYIKTMYGIDLKSEFVDDSDFQNELANRSFADADALAREVFARLSTALTPVTARSLAVNAAALVKVQQAVDEEYGQQGNADWTNDAGIYMFNYGFTYDGLPIYGSYARDYLHVPRVYQTMEYPPISCDAKAFVSEDGLFYLAANYVEPTETLKKGAVISYEAAEESLKAMFESVIMPNRIEIVRACLQYLIMPSEDGAGYQIVPAWCFYSDGFQDSVRYPSAQYCFDAFTGDMLK